MAFSVKVKGSWAGPQDTCEPSPGVPGQRGSAWTHKVWVHPADLEPLTGTTASAVVRCTEEKCCFQEILPSTLVTCICLSVSIGKWAEEGRVVWPARKTRWGSKCWWCFGAFLMRRCDLLPPRQPLSLEFPCSFHTAVCCFLKCYAFYSSSVTYKKDQLFSPYQYWFSAGLMSSINTEGIFLIDAIFSLLPLPHPCSHKLPLWTQMTPDFWNSLKRQTTSWSLMRKNRWLLTHLPACVNDVGFPPLGEE